MDMICVCIEHQLEGVVDEHDHADVITVPQSECEFFPCRRLVVG